MTRTTSKVKCNQVLAKKPKSKPKCFPQQVREKIMDSTVQLIKQLISYSEKIQIYHFRETFIEIEPQGWLEMRRDNDVCWSFFYGLLRFPGKSVMELQYNPQRQKIEKGRCYNPNIKTGWQTFATTSFDNLLLQMNLWASIIRGFFLRLIRHQTRQDSNISPFSEASTAEETSEMEVLPLKSYDLTLSPYGNLPPIDRLDCIEENLRNSIVCQSPINMTFP